MSANVAQGEKTTDENGLESGKPPEYNDPKTGQFVKGNPGGGRPKGSLGIWNQIRDAIDNPPPGINYRVAIAKVVLHQAIKGNWPFMQALLQRDSALETAMSEGSHDDIARDVIESLRKAKSSLEPPP